MKPSVNLLQYTLPSGFTIDIPDINSTLYIDVDQLSLCDDVLVDQDFIFRLLKYKGLDNNYYIFNSRFYEAFKYYLSKYSLASINNSNSVSSDGDIIDSKVVNSVLTRILKNTTTNVEAFEFTLFTVNNKDKYLTQYKLLVKFAIDGSLGDKAVMTFKKLGGTSSITISDDQPDQYNRTAIWIDTKRSTIHYWDGYRYTTPYASSIDLTIDNEVPVNPELADNGSVPSTKAVSLADQRLRNELSNLNLSVTSKLDDIDTNISNILLDLDKKVDKTSIGAINGVAGLDFTGKVPTSQLPDGIGEVISVNNKKGVVVLTKDDIGLNNVDNTSDVNKPISTLQKEALDTKVDKVPGKQLSTEDFTTALKKKLEELVPGGGVPDNILDLLNLKYDKSGGLISGDVQVNGLVEAKDDVVAYSNVRDIMLQASSGGSMYLYELLDVNITDPINGALLMYDSNSKMWINKDLTEDFTHIYNLIADKYDKTGGAITGNVQISGYLSVGERISGRLLSISEGATVNVLSVTTDASIGGNLNVSSGITCLTLDVKANAKVGLDLNVGDNVYAGKDVVAFSDKHDVLLLAEGGGATYLYELLDVDVTSVITGQYLKYDGTKWINSVISYTDISDLNNILNSKVDKVSGKELSSNDFTNAYKSKVDSIESGAQVNKVTSVAGKTGAVTLVKADVGLANVDNTSDATKPISTATQTALNGKLGKTETAADSGKLGGRAATDYWHKANSNINTVDWYANVGRFYSGVQTFGNDSYINLGVDKGGGAIIKYNVDGDLHLIPRSGYNSVFTRGFVKINEHIQCDTYRGTNGAYLMGIDTTTKIMGVGSQAANAVNVVKFDTNGAERMRIQSDGRIGVNRSSGISATFDVNGSIRANGGIWSENPSGVTAQGRYLELAKYKGSLPGYQNDYYPTLKTDFSSLYFSANNKYTGWIFNSTDGNNVEIGFNAMGVSAIRFSNCENSFVNIHGGNFGIGIKDGISAKLHVIGDSSSWSGIFKGSTVGGSSFGVHIEAGSNVNDTSFNVASYNGSSYFKIRGDGKIGVNQTTDIAAQLDVNGSIRGRGNVWAQNPKGINSQGTFIELGKYKGCLPSHPNDYYPVLRTDFTSLYFSTGGYYSAGIWSDSTNSAFFLMDSYNNTSVARIDGKNNSFVNVNGGNFGIGTKTPRVGLDVAGYDRAAIIGTTTGSGNTGKSYKLRLGLATTEHSGSPYWCFGVDDNITTAGKSKLRIGYTLDTTAITIDASRLVGINTTNPEATLDVNGNEIVRGNLIVKGEAVTYSQDGVQTTSVGMTRETYVPLSQFEAMEKRLSDQILLLQIEINKLKTN